MRNHDEYKELLSALLDGELDEETRDEVLAHLETCDECQTYFAELNAMRDALGDMDEIEAPAGFARDVMLRLHAEETAKPANSDMELKRAEARGRQSGQNRWFAMRLAACAAVAVAAFFMLPRGGSLPNIRMGGAAPASGSSSSSVQYAGVSADSAPAELYMADTTAEEAVPEAPMLAESKQMLDGGTPAAGAAMAEIAEEEAPAEFTTNTAAAPETAYDALPEAQSRDGAPTMTLTGDGAADWLAEHGEALGDGLWRVSVEDVNALPDTLELVGEDGVQQPVDGMLILTLGTTEATP